MFKEQADVLTSLRAAHIKSHDQTSARLADLGQTADKNTATLLGEIQKLREQPVGKTNARTKPSMSSGTSGSDQPQRRRHKPRGGGGGGGGGSGGDGDGDDDPDSPGEGPDGVGDGSGDDSDEKERERERRLRRERRQAKTASQAHRGDPISSSLIKAMRNEKDAVEAFGGSASIVAHLMHDVLGDALQTHDNSNASFAAAIRQQTATTQNTLTALQMGKRVRFDGVLTRQSTTETEAADVTIVDPNYRTALDINTGTTLKTVENIGDFLEELTDDIANYTRLDLETGLTQACEEDSIIDSRIALGKDGHEQIVATHPLAHFLNATDKAIWKLRTTILHWTREGVSDAVIVERVQKIFERVQKERGHAKAGQRTLGIAKGMAVLLQLTEVDYALGKVPKWMERLLKLNEKQVAELVTKEVDTRMVKHERETSTTLAAMRKEVADLKRDRNTKPPANPGGGGPGTTAPGNLKGGGGKGGGGKDAAGTDDRPPEKVWYNCTKGCKKPNGKPKRHNMAEGCPLDQSGSMLPALADAAAAAADADDV